MVSKTGKGIAFGSKMAGVGENGAVVGEGWREKGRVREIGWP